MPKPESVRATFKRLVGAALEPFGFDLKAGKPVFTRCPQPSIHQEVELVTSRSHDGEAFLNLTLGTTMHAFQGSPGLYGPGLHWMFTVDALVANPRIDCELRVSRAGPEDQIDRWLQSVCRELEGVGVEFFDRTSSLERILEFTDSEFYRTRSASESDVFKKLKRAMLFRLLDRTDDFEQEIDAAEDACHARFKSDLQQFITFLRGCEV